MNMGLVLDDVKVTGGHHYRHFVLWRALAAPGIFIWGTVARGVWGTEVRQWGPGTKPR